MRFDDEDNVDPETPEAPAPAPGLPKKEMSNEDMLGMALVSLAPALFGGLVGGKKGAMAGGAVGTGAVGTALTNKANAEAAAVAAQKARDASIADFKTKEQIKEDIHPKEPKKTPTRVVTKRNADGSETTEVIPDVIGEKRTSAPKPEKDDFSPKDDEKVGRDFAKAINPSLGRQGEFGKTQGRINSADRVLKLGVDKDGSIRNLQKTEVGEMGQAVAGLVSNGSVASQHLVDSVTPKSLWGDIKGQIAYITNDMTPADMQSFTARLVDTAKREKEVSESQKLDVQTQEIAAMHQWRMRNQDQWKRILRGAHLNPDDFDEESQYAPKPKAAAVTESVKPAGASASAKTAPLPAPYGNTVDQDGVTFKWDGQKYVPAEKK